MNQSYFRVSLLCLLSPSRCVSAHLGHAALGPRGLHVSCTPEPLGHSIKDHTRRAFYEVRLPSLHNLGVEWKNKAVFFIIYFFWEKELDFQTRSYLMFTLGLCP